jgi:hypothetical protein
MKPTIAPPQNQATLFGAHGELLDAATAWLNSAQPPIRTIGDRMLMALTSHIIQLGSAIQRLCETGHAGEAPPLARTMLSAGVILAYIGEDRDGRAIAYIQEDRQVRDAWIADVEREAKKAETAGKEFFVPKTERDYITAEQQRFTTMEDAKINAFAARGFVATKAGSNPNTWDGFNNERDRFEKMNGQRWYLAYYKKFSAEIHVSANVLAAILAESYAGFASYGAKYQDPLHVLKVSAEVVLSALTQLDMVYGLKQDAPIRAMNSRIGAALTAFARQTRR